MHQESDVELSYYKNRSDKNCPRDKAPDNSILKLIIFASKSLSSVERKYSNIEREALGILYRPEKFYNYCFAREVSRITDHKALEAIFKKDATMQLQRTQLIPLRIHRYRFRIIYKPEVDLFIADWLSKQNHKENRHRNTCYSFEY